MSLANITLEEIVDIVRGRGEPFTAQIRVNIEHRDPVRAGFAILQPPDTVSDCDVHLALAEERKTGMKRHGGLVLGLPGFAVAVDDRDDRMYLVLAIPLDGPPEEMP